MGQKETYDIHAIDVVTNLYTEEVVKMRPEWYKDFYTRRFGMEKGMLKGLSLEEILDKMDRAGTEIGFLIANKVGTLGSPHTWHLPYEMVAQAINKYPRHFRGLAGIDPNEGMKGVRELESAVKNFGFIGAHLYPHWFNLPPDAAKYYPFYAKCVELDIPIEIQVGHCLLYTAEYPLRSVGRPITLDTIACDFPDLKIIGIHIGYPWTDEMISVAWKHPNVYIGSDAYAPKHWPESFVNFINSWGQDKVLFGTDFPVLDFERVRKEVEALGLHPESKRKFLRENAKKVFKL